jgi:hypothetical protein
MFLLKITISGHFYLGSSLLELDKVDEAIKHLQTAFELGKKDPSSYYDDTIPSKLRWMPISKKFQVSVPQLGNGISIPVH